MDPGAQEQIVGQHVEFSCSDLLPEIVPRSSRNNSTKGFIDPEALAAEMPQAQESTQQSDCAEDKAPYKRIIRPDTCRTVM